MPAQQVVPEEWMKLQFGLDPPFLELSRSVDHEAFSCFVVDAQLGRTLDAGTNGRRVYVVDHDTWEASSTMIIHSGNGRATAHSGVRRVNTEQITNLAKVCKNITVTTDSSKADFFVVWDTKAWAQTSWSGHQNEFAIYNRDGDLVGAGEAHAISNSAKNICKILNQH